MPPANTLSEIENNNKKLVSALPFFFTTYHNTHQDDVAKLTEQTSESMLAETYANNLQYSLKWSEDLGVKLEQTTLNTTFNFDSMEGGGSLARQLEQVAKLIKVDVNKLENERASYFTALGGWDGR